MNNSKDRVGGQAAPDLMDSEGSTDFWREAHKAFDDLASRGSFDPPWMVGACQILDAVRRERTDGFGRRETKFVLKATAYLPLSKAAREGNRYAQYVLAVYYQAKLVLPDEPLAAFDALDAAAEHGDDGAQHAMEQIELAGPNVESPESPLKETPIAWSELAATYWMERAANQGLASAQAELAMMYFKGWGVPIDYVAAYMWSNLSGVAMSDKDRSVSSGRPVCFDLKMHKYASFEQVTEAQRLTRKFVPRSEEQESA